MSNIENCIDTLLIFMTDTLETHGCTIEEYDFDFEPGDPEFKAALNLTSLTNEEIANTLRICLSRKLVQCRFGNGGFSSLCLTEEGQGRALSAKLGNNRSYELGAAMNIANLTVNGPAQVGNYNTQEFQNCFQTLIQKIEATSASQKEKEEAKGLLKKALEHPLTSSIVGGVTGAVAGAFIK